MPILSEYAGPVRDRGFYSASDWNKLQNPDWAKDQAEYDAFATQAAARASSNAEAMARANEAIPYSYTQFGRGSTEPAFSLSGFAGQTSGGTAGLSGFAGTGSPTGTSTSSSGSATTSPGNTTPIDPEDPRNPRTDRVIERAEGGAVYPVQYMQEGGMIESPYANPMVQEIAPLGTRLSPLQPAIGGLFEAQFSGGQGAPLSGYQKFLMNTYGTRAVNNIQQHVGEDINQFVDLVREAEKAHFGNRPEMQNGAQPQPQPQPAFLEMDMRARPQPAFPPMDIRPYNQPPSALLDLEMRAQPMASEMGIASLAKASY